MGAAHTFLARWLFMTISILHHTVSTRLPTAEGQFQLVHYGHGPDCKEHLALVMGDLQQQEDVLVRIHSECFTGDVLGSRRCDCGEQLHMAMSMIAAAGQGVVIYLRQEGRGIGLQKKLEAYNLQDQGHDTVEANLLLGHQADERTYESAVAILQDLGVRSLRLLTNNPHKLEQLQQAGLTIHSRVPIVPTVHAENQLYLATKVARMRHLLQLPVNGNSHSKGNGSYTSSPALPIGATTLVEDLQRRADIYYAAHQLPFVTLSYAQSLDGSIAAADGAPLRISGDTAMRLTHMLRAAHDAILVGVGTVLADDPQLTVRLVPGADPQPIILDSRLRTPLSARCLANPRRPWLATTSPDPNCADPLTAAGAQLLTVAATPDGQVALQPLLQQLAAAGIRRIMVEGGATVLRNFLLARMAQAAVVTIAPIFVGGLPALAAGADGDRGTPVFPRLADPKLLQLGDDMICYGHFCP